LRVNRTLLTWTGYPREQLSAPRAFRDLLTVGGKIFYETHYAPLLAMQDSVSELALEIVRADKSTFPALVNSVLHRDPSGQPHVIRSVIISAAERRTYERELLAARKRAELVAKAKSDFVSMLSHDIRTPLSAVASVAEALETSELSAAQKNYLRLLRKGAEGLMALVNDVLDNSKLESGKMRLDIQPLSLRKLVGELVERLRFLADSKGVRLTANVDPRLPITLLGDPVKLGQIFTNLIGNAIKFTDEGSIEVNVDLLSSSERETRVAVRVMDTGIGVDPDHLGDIFDEFTQAYGQSPRSFGGAGLGLCISKKLIALHGGTICAKRRPGRGTSFEFSLSLRMP
jgi:signal transduction histidine kinase